jgi:hypothetical protein
LQELGKERDSYRIFEETIILSLAVRSKVLVSDPVPSSDVTTLTLQVQISDLNPGGYKSCVSLPWDLSIAAG